MSATCAAREAHDARIVLCESLGGPDALRLAAIRVPAPQADEVRVRVAACGLNFPDLLTLEGTYQHKPALPFSPGLEVSGRVLDHGPLVRDLKQGARVIVRTGTEFPGLCEEIVVPRDCVLPVPPSMDDIVAAGFAVVHLTAWHALVERARLMPGEWLLVHGAAGGTGMAAAQLGRALGARVIVCARGPQRIASLRALGFEHTIDHEAEDLRLRVKAITGAAGADVVFDPVGGAAFEASMRAIAPEGRLLVVGFASGAIPTVAANLLLIKEVAVIGLRAGEQARRNPQRLLPAYDRLCELFEAGRLVPQVGAVFPLERAADAMRALKARSVVGKVIVRVAPPHGGGP